MTQPWLKQPKLQTCHIVVEHSSKYTFPDWCYYEFGSSTKYLTMSTSFYYEDRFHAAILADSLLQFWQTPCSNSDRLQQTPHSCGNCDRPLTIVVIVTDPSQFW